MTAECVRCSRPMADQAYVDQHCAERALWQLLGDDSDDRRPGIADMAVAARDVANGLSANLSGSGGSGRPGSRLPLDLAATAKCDSVAGTLGSWLRLVAEERGGITADVSHWAEPIEGIATKLSGQLEWFRHRQFADEFFTDVEACWRVLRGIVREPAAQKYLGPCGALLCWRCDHEPEDPPCERTCDGDVYGHRGAKTGTCRTCGALVDQAERSAWLDGEVRGHAFRAAEIAGAYGVNVNTIRTWASRTRADTGEPALASYWRTDRGLVTPWTPTDDQDELEVRGPRLHYVGDVLDLAAADAARREGERAKRERRAAARAAESEEAA